MSESNTHELLIIAFREYFIAMQKWEKRRTLVAERALTTAVKRMQELLAIRKTEFKDFRRPKGKTRPNNISKFNAEHKGQARGAGLGKKKPESEDPEGETS